jgi:hypothetical protein
MMFLMLTLIVLGVANVNAQVQIGGTKGPDKSAVLDLNPDTGDANGGLALPRVALSSETQQLNGATAQPGTVVYNTGSVLDGEGTYVWTKVDGNTGTGFTGISKDNTGANTTIGGIGTQASPLTVNVNANGVNTAQIADHAVTAAKIASTEDDKGKVLVADGTGVFWSHQGASVSYLPADSVKNVSLSGLSASLTKIGTITVSFDGKSNHWILVPWDNLEIGDICNSYGGLVVVPWTRRLDIWISVPIDNSVRTLDFTCYRPSI